MNGHPPLRYLTDLDDDGKSGRRTVDMTKIVPGAIYVHREARPGMRPAIIAIAIIIAFAAGALIGHSIGIQHGKAVAQVTP